MTNRQDLEERLEFLHKLFEEVNRVDAFTESERIGIETEMEVCHEKMSCLDQNFEDMQIKEDQQRIAQTRQEVLNKVFSAAPQSVHDLMEIFVTEQERLQSTTEGNS